MAPSQNDNGGIGIAEHGYATKVKQLIKLVTDLRAIGYVLHAVLLNNTVTTNVQFISKCANRHRPTPNSRHWQPVCGQELTGGGNQRCMWHVLPDYG